MFVELKGIGFTNKGAELLCLAVMEQLDAHLPDCHYVLDPLSDYEDRRHYPFYTKFWMNVKGMQLGFLGRMIPQKFRRRFGIVLDSEIELILEASGFAYGDKWGYQKAHDRLGRYISDWKKQGKKVILLPQAFGPFLEERLRREMQHILRHADLVYARDTESLQYLQELGQFDNIRTAPDFTNLLQGEVPADFTPQKHRIAVIPNEKMLQMTTPEYAQGYQKRLVEILHWLEQQGRAPYVLIHEGEGDARLGQEIISQTGLDIPLLRYTSALHLKGILGTAEMVITSRFHGAVSALSQGVPTAVFGWSHKYRMLLQDYNCSHMLWDAQDTQVLELLQNAAEDLQLKELRATLLAAAQVEKDKARLMWDEVLTLIRHSP